MKCFYHRGDLDGRCSGAIIKRHAPECEMIGIDYGEPFPWESIGEDELVYMVDFSLQPFEDMVRLAMVADLVWIDHHKSAIEDAKLHDWVPNGVYILDTNFAACELCWEYCFPDEPLPHAVYLLGRYDIWKHHEVPGALEFQYGCRMYDTRLDDTLSEFWKDVLKSNGAWTGSVEFDGRRLLQYEKNQNAAFCAAYAFECELDGLKCIAANKGLGNSLVFESVWNPAKYDAMLMFAWKGTSWTVSLYSDRPDVDVSAVAKARGGGGHKGAAGFQCHVLDFLPGT